MANQIPFSGAANNSGGYAIPDKQAGTLVNAILQEAGSLALAGDRRATDARKEVFVIWLGQPTAGIVGEGAPKPVTGGELGQANLNIKKIASIVLFTDEQRDDVKNGDLDVLVDSGVRWSHRRRC
jgi:HK97 family phage major capsid protein